MKTTAFALIFASTLLMSCQNDTAINEIEEATGLSLSEYMMWGFIKIGNDVFLGDSITIYQLQRDPIIINPFINEDSYNKQLISGMQKKKAENIEGIARDLLKSFYYDNCPFFYYKCYQKPNINYHIYVEPCNWALCVVKEYQK